MSNSNTSHNVKSSLYKCVILTTIILHKSNYTRDNIRHVSYCTKSTVRVSHFDSCDTVKYVGYTCQISDVSEISRVLLVNFCSYTCPCWHVSHCENCKYNVSRSTIFPSARVPIYRRMSDTCLNLEVSYCTKFSCDTCQSLQNVWWQLYKCQVSYCTKYFVTRVQLWNRSYIKPSLWEFPTELRGILFKIWFDTCPYWLASHCTKHFVTRVRNDMYPKRHVATVTRWTVYEMFCSRCPYWHVSIFTFSTVNKMFCETCAGIHVSHWYKVLLRHVPILKCI